MIEVKIGGETYTEEQFKKDMARMFDCFRLKNSRSFGKSYCNNCECFKCPLRDENGCIARSDNSFLIVEIVHKWAKEHPVMTNRKKLKEVFGVEVTEPTCIYGELGHECATREYIFSNGTTKTIDLYSSSFEDISFNEWLNEEYKEPKKND